MTPEHAGGDLSALRERVVQIIEEEIDLVACGEGEWRIGGFESAADAILALLEQQP